MAENSTVAPPQVATLHIASTISPEREALMGRKYRIIQCALYLLGMGILYTPSNVMAPNLDAMAKSFRMSSKEKDAKLAGQVSAVFFLVGAPAAFISGYLSGRMNRRLLMACIACTSGVPMTLTFFIKNNYPLFFLFRALAGVSLGAVYPVLFSVLSDLVSKQHRSTVAGLVSLASGAGTIVGQGGAGFIGPSTSWRTPFFLFGLIQLAVAGACLFFTRDPPRGMVEEELRGQDYHERMTVAKIKQVLSIPTNVLIILQGFPANLPWGVLLVYSNDYLAINQGLGVQKATAILLAFGIGGAIGLAVGAFVGQKIYNACKRLVPTWVAVTTALAVLPVLFLVNARLRHTAFGLIFFVAFLGGMSIALGGPSTRALQLSANCPETRGAAVGLQSTLDAVGKGAGPAVVALMIRSYGRKKAFTYASLFWLLCAAILFCITFFVLSDERRVHVKLVRAGQGAAADDTSSLAESSSTLTLGTDDLEKGGREQAEGGASSSASEAPSTSRRPSGDRTLDAAPSRRNSSAYASAHHQGATVYPEPDCAPGPPSSPRKAARL